MTSPASLTAPLPSPVSSSPALSDYRLRLAESVNDLHAAQRLRYEVFNLELNEGLSASSETGRDEDRFDHNCDHLLVEHRATGQVVGTYRLQTGMLALAQEGYYSAQEFFFTPYEPIRHELIELGRACVHAAHRNRAVLHLLWRGIARYALDRQCRYLIGCSSLTTQDEGYGEAMYIELAATHLIREELQTAPLPGHGLRPVIEFPSDYPPLPRLLRAYLAIGAKICGRPAIDRQFGTIDFLTLLDLEAVTPAVRSHFLT